MADHTFKITRILSADPVNGLWADQSYVDDETGQAVPEFDSIVAMVVFEAQQRGRDKFSLAALVTKQDFDQINYNVLTNEGEFTAQDFRYRIYADADFEEVGFSLKPQAMARTA
jgi:hypothetical protein